VRGVESAAAWVNSIPGVRPTDQFIALDRRAFERCVERAMASTRVELKTYDAGLLGDGGGGDVDWWQDYIRAELARADEFYRDQVSA
jgi:hypothetical protein